MNKIYQKMYPLNKTPAKCNFGGFTLIELLVVVLIIGILAAVALPQYNRAVLRSRFVQMQTTAKSLYEANKLYYLANGEYADKLAALDISFSGRETTDSYVYFNGGGYCQLHKADVSCRIGNNIQAEYHIKAKYGSKKDVHFCYSYSGDNYAGDYLCQSLFPNKSWVNLCGGKNCHAWVD